MANFQSLVDAARPPREVALLLRAISGDDQTALAAWHEWKRRYSGADPRVAEERLFAAVGNKLVRLDIDAADKAGLSAAKRRVWSFNQLCLRGHARILEGLAAAGLPMMLLKGGARIAAEPGAIGTRVVRDIDVLFPTEHLCEAIQVLIALGMRSVNGRLPGMVKSQPFGYVRPDETSPAAAAEIDVHSVPLRFGQRGNWDDGLWQRAQSAEFLGVPVKVPSVSDRFVHAIAHGLVADDDSPADWAVDALVALRDQRFDPSVVASEIRLRRLGVPLAIGSTILHDTMLAEVPDIIHAACRRDLASPLFRTEMAASMVLGRERTLAQRLLVGVSEVTRSAFQARPARTWNTAWLLHPALRRPRCAWVPFSDGRAEVELPSGMAAPNGRLAVFVSGDGIGAEDRSFDLLLDGTWIGRIRVRRLGAVPYLQDRVMRARIRYRLPSTCLHSGSAKLSFVILDDNKMPSNRSPAGMRAAAQID